MTHDFIDKYATLSSCVHALDPKLKLGFAVVFIFGIAFIPRDCYALFSLLALVLIFLLWLALIPCKYVLKRSFVIMPFVFTVAVFIPFMRDDGLMIFLNILIKSYLSILVLILLTSTTKFSAILKSMEYFKVPRIFTMILAFMYRYLFVIYGELMKMKTAKDSRMVGNSWWLSTKTLAYMIGVLFIRSYERGEAVYMAMCARGYDGVPTDD